MKFLGELWRGERSLVFTFWVMGILVDVFLLSGLYGIIVGIGIGLAGGEVTDSGYVFIQIFWGFKQCCTGFIWVSIWRSARRYKEENETGGRWGTSAQGAAVLTGLYVLMDAWRFYQVDNLIQS